MRMERSISAGSRPTFSHHPSRARHLYAARSGSPKPFQMCACSATMRRVTFSQPPPIRIGITRVRGRVGPAQPLLDHWHRGVEVAQAPRDRAELVAVLVVVFAEPARAGAEDEPAAGDVVYGAGHVREQIRVALGVTGHQRAELDSLGNLDHRPKQRPAFEVLAL